jgi:hypothetical protein
MSEEITKHRVTMTNVVPRGRDEEGNVVLDQHVATDYVLPEHLELYVADAKLRWQLVEISDEPDAGPGGYEGETNFPEHLAKGISLEQHLKSQEA